MSLSIMGPSPYDWVGEKVGVGLSDFAFAMEIEELPVHESACAGMYDAAWQLALPFEWVALPEGQVQEKGENSSFFTGATSSGSQPAPSGKGHAQRGSRQQQLDGQRAFDELGYQSPRRQAYSPTEDVFCNASDAWWDGEKERANKAILGLELEHGRNTRLCVDGSQAHNRVDGHHERSSFGAKQGQTRASLSHHRAGSTPNSRRDVLALGPLSDLMA